MAGRKIRDEEDARACLAAARRAGVSRKDWARAHDVDGRSLHCWYLSLRASSGRLKPRKTSMPMVELVPDAEPEGEVCSSPFLVRIDGVEIEVGPDFEETDLVRLVRAIQSC